MSNSFAIPWTVAHQAPLSLEFPRQEYWSGLPFPSPGDFPDPGIEPVSPALADGFFYHWATRESNTWMCREKMLLLLAVGHWGVWKSFIFKKQKMVSFPICIYLITSEVVVQSSHVRLFLTPWTAAHQASLSVTISRSLLKLMSIESVMPSNHLILCRPFLPPSIFPSIRVFSKESVFPIRRPKYWNFSFSINPSNEYSGLISFRIDWLDLLEVQGTLKSLLQHL